jgi:hypothetical protein
VGDAGSRPCRQPAQGNDDQVSKEVSGSIVKKAAGAIPPFFFVLAREFAMHFCYDRIAKTT